MYVHIICLGSRGAAELECGEGRLEAPEAITGHAQHPLKALLSARRSWVGLGRKEFCFLPVFLSHSRSSTHGLLTLAASHTEV